MFYNFKCKNLVGEVTDFSVFKNKVVIIVNVASLCGFAPQYAQLQQLYEKYNNKLVVVAFPCNQFGRQEPLDGEQLLHHIHNAFHVNFPIMAKCEVNGDFESPIYTYLKSQISGKFGFKGVQWNFEKFIINHRGKVVARFLSDITPMQFSHVIDDLVAEIPDGSH